MQVHSRLYFNAPANPAPSLEKVDVQSTSTGCVSPLPSPSHTDAVNLSAGAVAFHFTMYCWDTVALQEPRRLAMPTRRQASKAELDFKRIILK